MKHTSKSLILAILAFSMAASAAAQSGTAATDSSRSAMSRTSGDAQSSASQYPARTSTIVGANVHNAEGKKLGEIKDMVINPGSAQVEYAIVNVGGFFGVAGKHVAVPWKQMQTAADGKSYVLNVDSDTLRSAPDVSSNRWAETATEQWVANNDRFWSSARSKTASGTTSSGTSSSGSSTGSGSDSSSYGKNK